MSFRLRALARPCRLQNVSAQRREACCRLQSTAVDGPAITQTNRAEATLSRFWKDVGIEPKGENSFAVTLDKRSLKTPSGKQLLLPADKHLVAALIAAEWENQKSALKPHALPMTSLASRALDAMTDASSREATAKGLLEYLDTDTVCFHQDYPDPLVRLQEQHWDPLLQWLRDTFDVEIHAFDSVLSHSQPEATKEKLLKVLMEFDPWQMAAMERVTHVTKSFVIALALVKQHLTVEQASLAARVEVESQIERWGEVEDTHDVDYHDVRRQLGSAACLMATV